MFRSARGRGESPSSGVVEQAISAIMLGAEAIGGDAEDAAPAGIPVD